MKMERLLIIWQLLIVDLILNIISTHTLYNLFIKLYKKYEKGVCYEYNKKTNLAIE